MNGLHLSSFFITMNTNETPARSDEHTQHIHKDTHIDRL